MFINKRKIIILWGIIVGLFIIIVAQAFGSDGFNMISSESRVKKEEVYQTPSSTEQKNQGKTIRICIQGAVKNPGTIVLPEKSRLEDGIKGAGGFLPSAATRYLNLAEFLEDGTMIYIQTKAESSSEPFDRANSVNGPTESKSFGKININKATVKELDSLPGVGEATAEKIIEYRKSKGAFKKIEDLKNVSGIGEGKFKKLKELIKV